MVKNLRKLRNFKGISQQQLADAVGSTQQSINKYENHGIEPDIYLLTRFADYFETTIDYLVGHTPPTSNQIDIEELELSKEEYALIRNYRKMSKDEKEAVRMIIRSFLGNKEP